MNEYLELVPQIKTLAAFGINLEMFVQSAVGWLSGVLYTCPIACCVETYRNQKRILTSVKAG